MNFKNKKVLITGGDRGIGKELVKVLIGKGVTDFAIMSRSLSGLPDLQKEFENINFTGFKGDMSSLDDIKQMVGEITEQWGVLDLLINNAGVVSAGLLEDISDEDINTMIQVNLTGPVWLTKHCLPLLLKSTSPAVVNLSSGLGLIAMPFYAVYASTKAGIRQFSDALRREFAPNEMQVLCVYPTATDTDMMSSSGRDNMDSPEMVARESIAALERGEINVVFGGRQREKDALFNFVYPETMDADIGKKYDQLKKSTQGHRAM